ncbi:hypothetical protein [Actinoplanes palleronii]|uniref:Uncharacterized protein n=1 Tax=Actinoplanes palleronii TaxID=113570 RepID=A0ABQ4B1W8_9ACTN|nr:hypothetical protein [Actinoplanes palleronii]GIE64656.1 hypothetical protein Apa02nite_007640 [Actinoplanes palleronii]
MSTPPQYQPPEYAQPTAPPPPPGPGVHPPFPAPPVEGRGRRIGFGLGIGAGVLVLICGGGLAAVIGLGVAMTGAVNEQAQTVVSDYLEAVQDADYDSAYDQLCQRTKDRQSLDEFRDEMSQRDKFDSFHVGDVDLVSGDVPVDLTYPGGKVDQVEAQLGQNTSTGAFEVCSLGE